MLVASWRARLAAVPRVFAAQIRNPLTRHAYGRAVADFSSGARRPECRRSPPLHVFAWIDRQTPTHAAPTTKLRLAAIRRLFDWLVMGQIVPVNPAGLVPRPAAAVRVGKTPVLDPEEARTLLDSIASLRTPGCATGR
jgi:site-specific recombinase XerC